MSLDIKKKDMIVDLDNSTITIKPLNLTLDIELVKTANERINQMEGIRAAQEKGKHIGRPLKEIDKFEYYYNQVKSGEITAKDAAAILGISRATFYRIKDKYENNEKMSY